MTGGVHSGALGFDAAADAYERGRPSYPAEAVGALVDALEIGSDSRVLELGAGTGKFTSMLPAPVVAVEPLAAMRHAFVAKLPDTPLVGAVAEALPVRDGCAAAVIAAQAFHWFEPRSALAEIRRVLRPGGGLGLIWNRRDETVPWVEALGALMAPYEADTPREYRRLWETSEWVDLGFTSLEERHFAMAQQLDADGLVDRVASVSFIAALEPAERGRLVEQIRALVADFDEPFVLPYRTGIHWCRRR